MTHMNCLRATLAASVCLLPLQAFAQDDGFDIGDKPATAAVEPASTNFLTLGAQYQSRPSTTIGRYTGVVDPGLYGIGDLHYGQRDAYDSGGTSYFEIDGKDLGLWSRSIAIKGGQQGTWGLNFTYDGIPYYATQNFQSVYQSNGNLIDGVAAASRSETFKLLVPTSKTASSVTVNSLWAPVSTNGIYLNTLNIDTRRDIFGADGKYKVGAWTITGGWKYEHKGGSYINSATLAGAPAPTSAGTGAAAPTAFTSGLVYFAQPIDYDTQRFDVKAAYGNDKVQAEVGYTYSQFVDNNSFVIARNPFNFFAATPAAFLSTFGGSAANISANYSLPPSNSAHQIKALLGYNFTPTTRLNVNLGYDVQLQNDAFVTGVGNTNIASPTLPRSSFDGMMTNFFGNAQLTARPIDNLDVRIAYKIDNRDNRSPRNTYTVYQRSLAPNEVSQTNLPYSYRTQSAVFEAGYRFAPQTKLTLNDTYENTWRNYAATSSVNSNKISAKLRSGLMDGLIGTLSLGYEDRNASNYNGQGSYTSLCNNCVVEPSNFVMFFEASRRRSEIKGTLDFAPTKDIQGALIVKYAQDKYPNSGYGLQNNHNLSVGPDLSWQVTKTVNTHAYYTFQQIYKDQTSIYTSGTAPYTATSNNYYAPWEAKTTDSVHTAGFNADWQVIPDTLKVAFDYSFSYGNTAYALGDGGAIWGGGLTSASQVSALTMQQLPDVNSMLSVVSLSAEYSINQNMTLMMGYAWERFLYKDFMQSSTQYSNAYLPGSLVPNESVHLIRAAMRYRF